MFPLCTARIMVASTFISYEIEKTSIEGFYRVNYHGSHSVNVFFYKTVRFTEKCTQNNYAQICLKYIQCCYVQFDFFQPLKLMIKRSTLIVHALCAA